MTAHFPELARLLHNDEDRVQRVVWEFYRSATKDLHQLDKAAGDRRWLAARDIARLIFFSCLQVGERDAAEAAADLARTPDELFADAYRERGPEIVCSLNRAEEFVARRIGGCQVGSDSADGEVTRH